MTHTIPANHLKSSSRILRTFEDNYKILVRLFAPLFNGEEAITLNAVDEAMPISATVCERHKYMTIIELNQRLADEPKIPDILLRLRIYFDARVAEVIGYQGIERIPARYQFKLERGDLRDEKMQVNLLLNEFLNHITDKGYRSLSASTVS
ncbi:MAG TPA: DUF1249 domain-containing protein [Ectothiorhodospiraceae bacterium]|nr:DUF1249 domain-containing protein [Ectothiorhodospiraceae bacterium]